jgi:hypothetical protein
LAEYKTESLKIQRLTAKGNRVTNDNEATDNNRARKDDESEELPHIY